MSTLVTMLLADAVRKGGPGSGPHPGEGPHSLKAGDQVRIHNHTTGVSYRSKVLAVRADRNGVIFSHTPGFSEHANLKGSSGHMYIGHDHITVNKV